MAEAWNVIQQAYVDQVALQQRRLAYGAIRGRISHCLLTTCRRINRAAADGSAVWYA